MPPTKTHISPEMTAAVGGELARSVSFPITDSDIRRWAIAVYYPEPPPRLFWDADHAATTVYGGIVAPEEFNPFAWMSRPDPEREGAHSGYPPEEAFGIAVPATSAVINGGIEVDYGARMRPGDVITSVRRLAGYSEREGRLGLMLFTTTEDTWTNQRGEMVKTTRGMIIRY